MPSQPAYAAPPTEPIWAALFALLQAKLAASYVTMSRRHTRPPALVADQQPALFLVQARRTFTPRPPGVPVKLTLSGFVILYFQCPAPGLDPVGAETVLGATTLNQLADGVAAAFAPDDTLTGKLTLGGLVTHCWLEGDADEDPGIYTQQGAAILPVKILVP